MGDSVGLETWRPCQPFPGPGVPMPRGSTAGVLRSHAAGTERLSGKCTRLACADGSSKGSPDAHPQQVQASATGQESHSHFTDEALEAQRGNCFAQAIQRLSGRARLQAQAPNRKASLVSKVHTVLAVLLALLSVMSDCQCPVRSHARHCQTLTHLIFIFRHPHSPIGQTGEQTPAEVIQPGCRRAGI